MVRRLDLDHAFPGRRPDAGPDPGGGLFGDGHDSRGSQPVRPEELEPGFFEPRSEDQYRDVYVAHHPAEPATSARGIRFSPFVDRQRELGAEFTNVATWERPQWFDRDTRHVKVPRRDEWASRHWSPAAIAEHQATRESAGLFDMTPLYRIEVTGPGAEAFLLSSVAARTDRAVGSVVYSVMLDARGGIR